jgi:thioesterase domain-containing protein/NAD(P)-dependent dehydrogenase (short-subunit alcohol dehydrogenase family)/acyl carrier protein
VRGVRVQQLVQAKTPGFKPGGTYLITGGFGGIGLTIAADLLKTHGAHVVLLSRRALPAREAWPRVLQTTHANDPAARRIRALQQLEGLGGTVEVAVADVVNVAQMRKVVDGLRAYGPIDGVIHAAGVLDDAPMLGKSQAQVDAVLAPKVQGLRVLDQLLPDGAVDLMVLFSSTSTATRAAGQVDYVAANDYLNAYAAARAGDQTRVIAVNWGVWADVGMAADAVGHAPVQTAVPRAVDLPLLSQVEVLEDETRFGTALEASRDWGLDQHRMADGTAVMPGAGLIEAMAQAVRESGQRVPFALRDVYFMRALIAAEGDQRQMRVTLHRDGGGYAVALSSDYTLDGRSGWQAHAQAQVSQVSGMPAQIDLEEISGRLGVVEDAEGAHMPTPQEAHLRFGPHWHLVRARQTGSHEGLARLMLEEPLDAAQILHPGLMDLATGWAIALAPGYDGADLWVPMSYGEIVVHDALPSEIYSWVRLRDSGADDARFDVTICDAAGRVLVEVHGFAMTRLKAGFTTQSAPLSASELQFDTDAPTDVRAPTAAEERLAFMVSQGITAAEGPQALARALALDVPQVYVSALPLQALIAQADTPPRETPKGQSFERTDLEGFVAPQGRVQEALAAMWSTLLGVSPVGADDSFFDLGGHSLIAVRLFAGVKREFGVDFPISVLFEAPTIAQIAARIAAQTGDEAGVTPGNPHETPAAPRFVHLVPLNGVSPTRAAPLFVVAGMFGNVLNLRHLALQFSDARAVYGLQARGLIGDSAPHETIEEAAADCIAEIRQVQPRGPYLLSGFSGGGITAYEMARQLKSAGEEVAVLALLDTPLPVRPALSTPDKAMIKLAELRANGPGYLVEWAKNRIAWEKSKRAGAPVQAADAQFNNTKIEAAFLRAVARYRTPVWEGPLTLLRPSLDRRYAVTGGNWVSGAREYVFADNDWTRYAAHTRVIEVPGDHDSMVLSPNVVVMAAELREVIDEALADTTPRRARAAE